MMIGFRLRILATFLIGIIVALIAWPSKHPTRIFTVFLLTAMVLQVMPFFVVPLHAAVYEDSWRQMYADGGFVNAVFWWLGYKFAVACQCTVSYP